MTHLALFISFRYTYKATS